MNMSELEKRRDELLREVCELPIFRPGTLTNRYRKCGKSNCHCADEKSKGHGPSWTITRKVKGKTAAKYVRVEMLEETQTQIENYHYFRETINRLVEINVKLCDAQLETDKQRATRTAEKKG
ncbi:MAG: hypothetical protein HN368_17485 [Spirochaetales bacterium]|jgi:hypothetical protein|nr:hypothetical protein [Spirochaetales bacterium]